MPRLVGLRNYLNNYFFFLFLFILPCKTSEALPYTRGARIPRLLGVRYYLNNYFANYTLMAHSRIRVETASPACFGLGIN